MEWNQSKQTNLYVLETAIVNFHVKHQILVFYHHSLHSNHQKPLASATLPETNIPPENEGLEDDISFWGPLPSFRCELSVSGSVWEPTYLQNTSYHPAISRWATKKTLLLSIILVG